MFLQSGCVFKRSGNFPVLSGWTSGSFVALTCSKTVKAGYYNNPVVLTCHNSHNLYIFRYSVDTASTGRLLYKIIP